MRGIGNSDGRSLEADRQRQSRLMHIDDDLLLSLKGINAAVLKLNRNI